FRRAVRFSQRSRHRFGATTRGFAPGTIAQILPVSGVYAGTQQQQLVARTRPATQMARIRFDPGASPPPLNTTVDVRMHYTRFSAHVAGVLIWLFGLY